VPYFVTCSPCSAESHRAERDGEIAAVEGKPNQVHLLVKARPKDSRSYVAHRFEGFTCHDLRAIGASNIKRAGLVLRDAHAA
jgi:REP element-mobilizing transposase RayT